jgi:hypothetical protein
MGLKVF